MREIGNLMRYVHQDVAKEVALRAAEVAAGERSLRKLKEFMGMLGIDEDVQQRVIKTVKRFHGQPVVVAGSVLAILDAEMKTRRRDLDSFARALEKRLDITG